MGDRERVLRYRHPQVTEGNLFIAVGAALALVGFVDVALAWYPMQWGYASWWVAAVGRAFDSAPMTVVGLVLFAVGLVRRQVRPVVMRRAAVVYAALSLVLLVMAMLFAFSAAMVLSRTSGAVGTDDLGRSIVKTGIQVVVCPVTLMSMAAVLWTSVWRDKED